jgi:replicative DNA helicase
VSALGEKTLIQHLVDRESLDTLAREGLPEECVPTEELRRVLHFCLDYFHHSGRTKAPSVAVVRAEYGDLLDDHEIDLTHEPEDSVEWAIDDLKGTFAYKRTATFNKALAAAMAEAETAQRVAVVNEYATELVSLAMALESHESKVDARVGMTERLQAYEDRASDRDSVYGLRFGLPQIDDYTRGIHPGELAVLAAGPKVGKSYLLDLVALREWQAGRTTVLYTLENSVEMTLDRIACLATGVDSRRWQHGDCNEDEVSLIRGWTEEVVTADVPLHVVQPAPGQRSVEAMVRQAQLLDADSLILDQLTFIEPQDERAPRHLQIREITHTLKSLISTGRGRMPCLLAHQINREGVKAADKVGYLEMYHLAEGSEVERTADWVFGLYRSEAERATLQAKFQTLAARREDLRHFQLNWNIGTGFVNVRSQIQLTDGG